MSINKLATSPISRNLPKTIFFSLISSIIAISIFYFLKLRYLENISTYGFSIFFSILTYALILQSVKQVRTHGEFPCTSGMMIGMTIGFIAGFLSGFYIGATNGMFWGSMFGITIGLMFGIWCGLCCGIMGVMEGMIAGLMGGLMGTMTAVMTLNDHLKATGIIVFIICSFIMAGLNYMMIQETRSKIRKYINGELFTIFWSIALTLLTTTFIIFGPRG